MHYSSHKAMKICSEIIMTCDSPYKEWYYGILWILKMCIGIYIFLNIPITALFVESVSIQTLYSNLGLKYPRSVYGVVCICENRMLIWIHMLCLKILDMEIRSYVLTTKAIGTVVVDYHIRLAAWFKTDRYINSSTICLTVVAFNINSLASQFLSQFGYCCWKPSLASYVVTVNRQL